MKTLRWLIGVPFLVVAVYMSTYDLMARRVRHIQPQQKDTSTNSVSTNSVPKPKDKKFKDLALNTVFYFSADSNKFFPRTKISQTTAKNNKDGSVATIGPETIVITDSSKSDSKKDKASAK